MKTKSKKTKPLAEKTQTDGKVLQPVAHNLAEVWGIKNSKYGTMDEEAYRLKLSKLNKVELFHLCTKLGIGPHDLRETMIERLLKDFRQYVASVKTAHVRPFPAPVLDEQATKVKVWLDSVGGRRRS
jgi:hypothetical protein